MENKETIRLIDALYKAESGRLLAVLTRLLGPENLALAEDVLQEAFSRALQHWQAKGLPVNPAAWLMTTAKNRAVDVIRANKNNIKFAADLAYYLKSEWSLRTTVENQFREENIQDDQLRIMFMCCRETIPAANQIPLMLKMLCGFTIAAVSRSLLIPQATVKKRLLRTKQALKNADFQMPAPEHMEAALNTVHTVLYLFFNEGFNRSHNDAPIDPVLCHEAIGLLNLLIETPRLANADTFALRALLHFHMARITSRLDNARQAIPLDQQDRNLWDKREIALGDAMLKMAQEKIASGTGRYLCEALILQQHCHASSFESTKWHSIVHYYNHLIAITASPVAMLNRAVAIAYGGEIETAIQQVQMLQKNKAFKYSHLPTATLAHLYAKMGKAEKAFHFAEQSRQLGGTLAEQNLMVQQIKKLLS